MGYVKEKEEKEQGDRRRMTKRIEEMKLTSQEDQLVEKYSECKVKKKLQCR